VTDWADFFGLPNPVIWERVVLQRGAQIGVEVSP
jgi:hypothetical protein